MSQAEIAPPAVERCPVAHTMAPAAPGPASERSGADRFMRRLLRVPEGPATANAESAQRMFSQSILISATRCLLTYVLLPIVAPAIGAATHIGPVIGIPLGLVAMCFDVLAVRRFWLANHRYRWICTAVYAVIISFLLGLMVVDIVRLSAHGLH